MISNTDRMMVYPIQYCLLIIPYCLQFVGREVLMISNTDRMMVYPIQYCLKFLTTFKLSPNW